MRRLQEDNVEEDGLSPGQRLAFIVLATVFGLIFLGTSSAVLIPLLQRSIAAQDQDVYVASGGEPASSQQSEASEESDDGTEEGDDETDQEGDDDTEEEESNPVDQSLDPREKFNRGVELLTAQDLEGAEAHFLEARDEARKDRELRYRAAFNLGMTYAAKADAAGEPTELETEKLEEVRHNLEQSAAWFRDAIRLRPDNDARVNLELILTRMARVTDILNQRENVLEKRLKKVIESERALRHGIRELANQVRDSEAADEPVQFRDAFDSLASQQRSLLTEANEVATMAGDELGLLEQTPEDERKDKDRVRLAQLKGLTHYLDRARSTMANARRSLRKLETQMAHRKTDESLRYLKRAQSQLANPITVLRQIAADQRVLQLQTENLERFEGGDIRLESGDQATAPAWLTSEWLRDRQKDLLERTGEMSARFQAALGAQDSTPDDPTTQQQLKAVGEAVPHLQNAMQAMVRSRDGLAESSWSQAMDGQTEASQELNLALERFANYRQLIELAWADHRKMMDLLTDEPDVAATEDKEPLTADERSAKVRTLLRRNQERMARLEGMFDQELTDLRQQKASASAQQGGGSGPQQAQQGQQANPEKIEADIRKFQQAQVLRQLASTALSDLETNLDTLDSAATSTTLGDGGQPPVDSSAATLQAVQDSGDRAEEQLEQMRLLFFTIVEHLRDLARRQSETLDETASVDAQYPAEADGSDSPERLAAAQPLSVEQNEHATFAEEIADALEKQADQAAQQPQQGGQQPQQPGQMSPQEMSRRLSAAATEVSAAASEMRSANGGLTQAPLELGPTTDHQNKALEHLVEAIRLLQPPKQQQQKQNQQKQSKSEAERKLQAVRDREAKRRRQRERRRKHKTPAEPVEKDW